MLWSASLTTFFSFCRSGEITVENVDNYDPSTHLSFADVAVDNPSSPSVISLNIKYSKTDTGRAGYQVVLGGTGDDLCPVTALLTYLARRGDKPGALFQWKDGTPLSKSKFVEAVRQRCQQLTFQLGTMPVTALGSEQPQQQQWREWKTQQSKHWDAGEVHPIFFTFEWTLGNWPPYHHPYPAATYNYWYCCYRLATTS